ncbi:MAG: spore cortex biosynthesis protein YabQ, partial [Syntrophomonadaceae bacterium]|nr:spore cortex biosynthesis protein YabQ [Syntrophomonadaceae bacterium]
ILTGLLGQIEAFILTLVLGLLTGTIFHFYQELIRAARVSRYVLYLLDFSLWMIIIALVFLGMLFINQGEMRIYVLIALVLGILIYYRRFASRLDAPISRLAGAMVTTVAALVRNIKKVQFWAKKIIAKLKPQPKDPPADSED